MPRLSRRTLLSLPALLPGLPSLACTPHRSEAPVAGSRVMVVINANSVESRTIGNYYAEKRQIPLENILRVTCVTKDEWKRIEYQTQLETFVRQYLNRNPAIDFLVLTRGIPFRISDFGVEGGYSPDSILTTCLLPERPKEILPNPYKGKAEPFSRQKTGLVLVTRLDGTSVETAKKLVDSSVNAKPVLGPFYLRDSFVLGMQPAQKMLTEKGYKVEWISGFNNAKYPQYEGSGGPFMCHFGAGPHDTQFTEEEYAAIRFLPGALGELTWSASAAGLRNRKSQGNIAIMAENGAAGVMGFVSEPYADAISDPAIVLERYTRGYNLAESFYMGSPFLHWKNLLLGDPLCAPYTKPGQTLPSAAKAV